MIIQRGQVTGVGERITDKGKKKRIYVESIDMTVQTNGELNREECVEIDMIVEECIERIKKTVSNFSND